MFEETWIELFEDDREFKDLKKFWRTFKTFSGVGVKFGKIMFIVLATLFILFGLA